MPEVCFDKDGLIVDDAIEFVERWFLEELGMEYGISNDGDLVDDEVDILEAVKFYREHHP